MPEQNINTHNKKQEQPQTKGGFEESPIPVPHQVEKIKQEKPDIPKGVFFVNTPENSGFSTH